MNAHALTAEAETDVARPRRCTTRAGQMSVTWIRRESDTILRKMAENGGFIEKALAAVDRF
jgi:hypothetical protein